tara:strand:- start:691 stop:1320 length:630 start_codon:yes stop_codon:yes gene_type:complete
MNTEIEPVDDASAKIVKHWKTIVPILLLATFTSVNVTTLILSFDAPMSNAVDLGWKLVFPFLAVVSWSIVTLVGVENRHSLKNEGLEYFSSHILLAVGVPAVAAHTLILIEKINHKTINVSQPPTIILCEIVKNTFAFYLWQWARIARTKGYLIRSLAIDVVVGLWILVSLMRLVILMRSFFSTESFATLYWNPIGEWNYTKQSLCPFH